MFSLELCKDKKRHFVSWSDIDRLY